MKNVKLEILNELKRRNKILAQHLEPNAIELHSRTSFIMALCPVGKAINYEWADEEYSKPVMTSEEFRSSTYDFLFDNLMWDAKRMVKMKVKAAKKTKDK